MAEHKGLAYDATELVKVLVDVDGSESALWDKPLKSKNDLAVAALHNAAVLSTFLWRLVVKRFFKESETPIVIAVPMVIVLPALTRAGFKAVRGNPDKWFGSPLGLKAVREAWTQLCVIGLRMRCRFLLLDTPEGDADRFLNALFPPLGKKQTGWDRNRISTTGVIVVVPHANQFSAKALPRKSPEGAWVVRHPTDTKIVIKNGGYAIKRLAIKKD